MINHYNTEILFLSILPNLTVLLLVVLIKNRKNGFHSDSSAKSITHGIVQFDRNIYQFLMLILILISIMVIILPTFLVLNQGDYLTIVLFVLIPFISWIILAAIDKRQENSETDTHRTPKTEIDSFHDLKVD